jgi:hypothetical protein
MPVTSTIASAPAKLTQLPARARRTRDTARKAAKAGFVAGRTLERGRRTGSTAGEKAPNPALFAVGAAAGVGAGFFLDPQNGKRRRNVARDKIFARGRRGAREAEQKARYAAGFAGGAAAKAKESPRDPEHELNDPALAQKVESEIFRPEDAPKGEVNVNVEHGVVILRGHLEDPNQAEALVAAAEQVEGVRAVESKLTVA